MSSFILSKPEVVVLFELMADSSIPVGIKDLPQVDVFEYERIVDSFSAIHLVDKTSQTFKPDKGLEKFLLPIVTAEKILLFNYGKDSTCTFNTSIYFSRKGLVALLDHIDATIKFVTISSFDELLLYIPDLDENIVSVEGTELYISYLLFDKVSSIVHCTRIDTKKNLARIVEGKRIPGEAPLESSSETEILEYKEMLYDKLKEVYDVVSR